MPSVSNMANFSKGEPERSGFFGKMKRKFTKSKQRPNRDSTDGHCIIAQKSECRDVDSESGAVMNGRTLHQNGGAEFAGFSSPNGSACSSSPDDVASDYVDIPELLHSRYQQQGARPKSTGAADNVAAPLPNSVNDMSTSSSSSSVSAAAVNHKSPSNDVPDGDCLDAINEVHMNQSLTMEEIEMIDADGGEDEPETTDSKESLEPLIVQMSADLPNDRRAFVSKSWKSAREETQESIPENGQIVDVCTDEGLSKIMQGSVDVNQNKDSLDQDLPCIDDTGMRQVEEPVCEKATDENISDPADNTSSIDKEKTESGGKSVRPKCPTRPLSLNLNLEFPPPIPPRSPLTKTFSLAEPDTRSPSDTSVLEDGSSSHVFIPSGGIFAKGKSKSLPRSPGSLSPSSPVDKSKKSKSNRFSWFMKGKGSRDRHSVHVTMMANRTLPDIPDEEGSPSSRRRSYHPAYPNNSRDTLPNSQESPGPRSPKSPDDRKSDDNDMDLGKFTSSLRKLAECGWYWGPMNWDDAEAKLADAPDGAFLVRDSSNDRYILSLSFRSQGTTHHTRIEHSQGMFGFWSQPQSHGSSSIVEFIEKAMQHSKNGKFLYFLRPRYPGAPPIPVQLTQPISRFKRVQTLQHMCRFLIRKLVRLDHIQTLPLPRRVKEYLLEGQYYTPEDVRPVEDGDSGDDEREF